MARPSLTQRFWSKVCIADGDNCWLWTSGLTIYGYGSFGVEGRSEKAPRVSWVLTYGPIPNGLHVLHRCDTPACVRPDHLFLGTPLDNIRDMIAKGRKAPTPTGPRLTHCKNGHPRTEDNLYFRKGNPSGVCKVCFKAYRQKWSRARKNGVPFSRKYSEVGL